MTEPIHVDKKQIAQDDNANTAMQCAEITGPGKPLLVTSRDRPAVPDEGVLLRTLYGGVCHSDVHFIDESTLLSGEDMVKYSEVLGEAFTGMIPGHEICGVVEELGKGAEGNTSLKKGDTVVVLPWRGCGQCEACSGGQANLCENNEQGTTDIGQGVHGGGYGSYVCVPEAELCLKLPAGIPPQIGCMLPCGALTAYHALKRALPTLQAAVRLRGVANLLVVGAGGVGVWVVVLVKHVLCNGTIKVICADTVKEKLDSAAKLEADDVVEWNKSDDVTTTVANTTMSGYNLIDAVIDFVATPKTVEIALECLHRGGTIVLVGLHGGEFPLCLPILIAKSISIQGVRTGGKDLLKELLDLLAVQQIETYPPVEIITLDQINDVLDRLRRGEVKGRAIIKHSEPS